MEIIQIYKVIDVKFFIFLCISFVIFFLFLNKRLEIAYNLKIIDRPV